MMFEAAITGTPRPFHKERAQEAHQACPWATGAILTLLTGAAGCSPYLLSLLQKEGAWLESAVSDPGAALASEFEALSHQSLADLPNGLRCAKRRVALLSALADLGGVWSLEDVTHCLSTFAGLAVDLAAKALVTDGIARGNFPGLGDTDGQTAGGFTALAMGKMGAGELNYSSDIDLICLFDDSRFDRDDWATARASFVKVTRKLAAMLADNTAEGYVFRTDLRLRPDPSVTPVCISMDAAERYYEGEGRTWERAAFIKARACAGDVAAGQSFLHRLTPFVWRKHLDFAAIEDAHDMRLRIRDHKGFHGALDLDGHNIKLGRGGIREIEFFAQTRQLIAGGRDETLRDRGTTSALAALASAGWIDKATSETLTGNYRWHRTIEHRLQMINDQQTHDLPKSDDGWERLAAFLDTDVAKIKTELKERLATVHDLTEGFFAPSTPSPEPNDAWGQDAAEQWLRYPALRSPRAVAIFERLWPSIKDKLMNAPKPDEALVRFDGFLSGLPAGVQLFSLFEANPQLTQLFVDIVATAPALSHYLSRHSGVLDAVLAGAFFQELPATDVLTSQLKQQLEPGDYETKLTIARKWAAERHFQIGVHHLRELSDALSTSDDYARLAEAVVAAIWPVVTAEFARKHGPAPGRGAAVLAMGSLGAGRLNAVSDLDLIVVYDAGGAEYSDGPRPLAARPYFARLTQALITALSAPMADGRLFEVDMRLRPSGRQGPVATSLAAFETYQHDDAWTWEHLALTRARVIAGDASLAADVERVRSTVLSAKSGGAEILKDVTSMRERLALAKPPVSEWDVRNGAGGLQDLELYAQTVALQSAAAATGQIPTDFQGQINQGVATGWLDDAIGRQLSDVNRFLWGIHAASRLLTGSVFDPEEAGTLGSDFLLRVAKHTDLAALNEKVSSQIETAKRLIDEGLKGP